MRAALEGDSHGTKSPRMHRPGEKRPPSIFLLSPANVSGVRGKALFNSDSRFELAVRARGTGAPLGEIYSFISSLYFRGKLEYARMFGNPPPGVPAVHIITAAGGLISPDTLITVNDLRRLSAARVDSSNRAYREPLDHDARLLQARIEPDTQIVLLGSIATSKYVEPLIEVFGEQLLFPKEFVGRGDMSRGGLLLRSCSAGQPLECAPVSGAVRRGKRPGRLAAI